MLPEINGSLLTVNPNKIAVIFNDRATTYGQLDTLVQQIANTLLGYGYNGGHKIAIIAKNSLNLFALYLACRRTNNVAVMINWKLPVEMQERMMAQCSVSRVYRDDDLDNIELTEGPMNYTCNPDAPGLFLFTSGTTGEPKAAVITNKNRQTTAVKLHKLPTFNTRIIPTPFYHINGFNISEHSLVNEGTIIIMSEFRADEFLRLITKYKVDRLTLVPSMMAMVLDSPVIHKYNLDFVQGILLVASPVSLKLMQRIKADFRNADVIVSYGLTEFGPAFGPAPEGMTAPLLSCGYPIDGVEYMLVDGVLHLRGASMSKQYFNSAASKVSEGWLNTGDLFRVDENGFYFFMGRADDMHKVNGEQVYPIEIETALENVPGVKQACVVMIEDDVSGFKPYAFCTGVFDEDNVKEELLKSLPRFKIPRKIWAIDEIPLMGVKVDRNALKEKAKDLI